MTSETDTSEVTLSITLCQNVDPFS